MARAWWTQDEDDDEYCSDCGMVLAFHDDGECPSAAQRAGLQSPYVRPDRYAYVSIALEDVA